MKSGAMTSVIVASSFTRTCSEGPAVSLKGSPTVSPTTAAACASVRLPSTLPASSVNWPDSMYFLALSHAPPPLLRTVASMTPAMVPTISIPAIASYPRISPTRMGVALGKRLGRVSDRVEAIGDLACLRLRVAELGNPTRIVGDRSKGIHGEDEGGCHQHAHGRDRRPEDAAHVGAGLRVDEIRLLA